MTINFSEETLKAYFGPETPFFRKGDSIVFKVSGMNGREEVVVVKDAYIPNEDGEWKFYAWRPEDLSPDYKFPEIPDTQYYLDLPGYFGKLSGPLQQLADFCEKPVNDIPLVVAICGLSGSGKTSLALYLQEKHDIKTIVSYTTREKRPGEVEGVQHIFVSEKAMPNKEEMLAYTYFGNNHYWAEIRDLQNMNTYTIDEQGILDLFELASGKDPKIRLLWVQIERPNNPTDSERTGRDVCRKEALEKLETLNLKPDINIVNDYGSVTEFVENEGSELASYLKRFF